MGRLIAIGDIHGRLSKLEGLIDKIAPQENDQIIFLGDYIDRGPESYQVVEYVKKFKKLFKLTLTLRGNHEDFVVSLFKGNMSQYLRNIWLEDNGGKLTLSSYKKAGHFLKIHQDFFMSLPVYYETEKYIFCHAGVRPGIPLNKQKMSDLLEIREPFLSSEQNFGKIIVHGHTMVNSPEILFNRINIDTGAGHYGPLTAIELPSLKIWQQM